MNYTILQPLVFSLQLEDTFILLLVSSSTSDSIRCLALGKQSLSQTF